MVGLYDGEGVFRCAGRDRDDCLAYAELFALDPQTYSLESVAVEESHQSVRDFQELVAV